MSRLDQQKPKAIIFDLLTGLLDSWTLWNSCAGSEAAGRKWRQNYLTITFGQGTYAPYPDLVRRAAASTSELPTDAAEALIQRWDELEPWPEVPRVLRQLRELGYRLGVYTNCSKVMGHQAAERSSGNYLSSTDTKFRFDEVLTAEEIGFYKPHPKAYAAIIERLGCRPDECVFVAGSPGDVIGATDAGMRVVWHNHVGLEAKRRDDGSVVEPEVECNDLNVGLVKAGILQLAED